MADNPRIEELRRRVQSDPASIAFAALAEEYRRSGRFDEAIDTCNTGLQRHPSYLSAHVTLGRALLEVGRFDEAQQQLEYVLKLAPENLAAIRGLAEIHHRRGDDEPNPAAPEPLAPPQPASPPIRLDLAPAVPPPPLDLPLEPPPAAAPPPIDLALNVPAAAPPDPALAGLQSFLEAIERARAARQSPAH